MPTISVKGKAAVSSSTPIARIPIVQSAKPPAPRIVGHGIAVPVVPARAPATPSRLPAAGARPTIAPFRFLSWRVMGRNQVKGLDGLAAPQDITAPTPVQLTMMLDAGNAFLDMAIDSCRHFLAWGFGAASSAYERGSTPAEIWGETLARDIAHKALVAGGLLHLRKQLASGEWSWLIEGDTLAAWQTDTLTRAASGAMGWVSNSYITGNPDPRIQPTALDRLGFAAGGMALSGVIAGPAAAADAAVSAGIATSDEAAAAVASAVPQAVRAAGAGASPAAAGAAAAGMSRAYQALFAFGERTQAIKWTAVAIVGTVLATRIQDALNALRSGQTRVGEAGANAAGALVQHGISTNNPEEIAAGLGALQQFQKTAGEGDKYLWGAGGFVASEILRRR